MRRKQNWWYRLMVLALALILLVPVLAGCGDDIDETTTPTATTPATTTPASTEPVKIGLVSDWTGPTGTTGSFHDKGIGVFLDEIKAQGGLLGREVQVVTADGQGTVSGGAAAAIKLITQEKVSVIVGGGGSSSELIAVSNTCNQYKVPFVNWGGQPYDLSQTPYTINAYNVDDRLIFQVGGQFAIDKLGAKKIAVLGENSDSGRANVDALKTVLTPANVDLADVEYINVGTTDFSPYLTKSKAAGPDTILMYSQSPVAYMTVFKQMAELGMTDIKFVAVCLASMFAVSIPQAVGSYHVLSWLPTSTTPANVTYVTDFKAKYGEDPNTATSMAYHVCWTAAHAIQMAGSTDRDAIQKVMRSGNLAFDSIFGPGFKIGTDGWQNVKPIVAVVGTDHGFTVVYP